MFKAKIAAFLFVLLFALQAFASDIGGGTNYKPSAVAITGGTINGTSIGQGTPAAGSFSTLGSASATLTGGTINNMAIGGIIPSSGTFSSLSSASAVLTGGTINGMVIGGVTPAVGNFSTANASSFVGPLTGNVTGNLTGNVTGNVSGTAATVTGATQSAITSAPNLATVGTIGSGTWNGTLIDVTHGGTNSSTGPGALANLNGLTAWVTKRGPAPTDDSSAAYAVGQFWLYNNTMWISNYVGIGQANWQVVLPPSAPILDVVSGAAGAYGVYRLSSTYAGNAFQVTRSSDSTTSNIAFDVNGIASWSAVDKFCSGTSCYVSIWYDQSGNSYDLAQATLANMPQILGDTVHGLRAISFNGGGNTGFNEYLANSSLPISDIRNFTVLFVGRQYLAAPAQQGLIFQVGTSTNKFFLFNADMQSTPYGLVYNSTGGNGIASGLSFTSPEILITLVSSGTVSIKQNDQSQTFTGTTGASLLAMTGFQIGYSSVNTASALLDALAFVIYNSPLSTANQQLLAESSYQTTAIQPQIRDQMVMMGSSLLSGCTTGCSSYPQGIFAGQLDTDFYRPMNQINMGRSGTTTAILAPLSAGVAARAYLAGAKNYEVTDVVGSNDLAISTSITPATVCGNYQTIGAAFKSGNFIKVGMSTITPRNGLFSGGVTGASFQTQRASFNTLLLGGCAAAADAYVDPGNDPTIGSTGALTDTTLYYTDQVHTTVPLGASYLAASWLRGLANMLQ